MSSRRYRGILAYDGTRYQGFQRQAAGKLTIQGELERAIDNVTAQQITIMGAGRTDAGVHATKQVVAFDCVWRHETASLLRAINANLPSDIALKSLDEAAADFHPRYDALSRRYVYHFYAAAVREPMPLMVSICLIRSSGNARKAFSNSFSSFDSAFRDCWSSRTD